MGLTVSVCTVLILHRALFHLWTLTCMLPSHVTGIHCSHLWGAFPQDFDPILLELMDRASTDCEADLSTVLSKSFSDSPVEECTDMWLGTLCSVGVMHVSFTLAVSSLLNGSWGFYNPPFWWWGVVMHLPLHSFQRFKPWFILDSCHCPSILDTCSQIWQSSLCHCCLCNTWNLSAVMCLSILGTTKYLLIQIPCGVGIHLCTVSETKVLWKGVWMKNSIIQICYSCQKETVLRSQLSNKKARISALEVCGEGNSQFSKCIDYQVSLSNNWLYYYNKVVWTSSVA